MHDFRELKNPSRFHWSDEFKKSHDNLGSHGCHPDTLIDLANIAPANKSSVEPICMISEGYRTHGGVTAPTIFKSRTFFFFWKSVLPGFWGPWLPSSTLIDLADTALAKKKFRGAQMHDFRGIQNPWRRDCSDDFQKWDVFFWKSVLPGFWGPWLPSKHLN